MYSSAENLYHIIHHLNLMLLNMVKKASTTEASIYNLDNEKAKVYLQKKLSVGREAADKILTSFKLYGGKSKWDLTNAITDYP